MVIYWSVHIALFVHQLQPMESGTGDWEKANKIGNWLPIGGRFVRSINIPEFYHRFNLRSSSEWLSTRMRRKCGHVLQLGPKGFCYSTSLILNATKHPFCWCITSHPSNPQRITEQSTRYTNNLSWVFDLQFHMCAVPYAHIPCGVMHFLVRESYSLRLDRSGRFTLSAVCNSIPMNLSTITCRGLTSLNGSKYHAFRDCRKKNHSRASATCVLKLGHRGKASEQEKSLNCIHHNPEFPSAVWFLSWRKVLLFLEGSRENSQKPGFSLLYVDAQMFL